jgi:hypothetical protein
MGTSPTWTATIYGHALTRDNGRIWPHTLWVWYVFLLNDKGSFKLPVLSYRIVDKYWSYAPGALVVLSSLNVS